MQIPLNGQAFKHPSQDVNYQRCVNLFPTSGGDAGRGQIVMLPTPGLLSLVDGAGNTVRGLLTYDDSLYAVIDNTFYEVTLNTTAVSASLTSRGTLLSGSSAPVNMKRNATQIMIVDNLNHGYVYTPASTTFAQITDADFLGAGSLAYVDSYFFYHVPGSSNIFATGIGDGTSVSALDVVSAESSPDTMVGLAVDKRELWAFGANSVEIYYNAANATGFPFSLRDGAFIDVGCSAGNSIVSAGNNLYWLDSRRYIVRNNGYDIEMVSTEAINDAISSYSVVSDAIAFSYSELGHTFYVISFPTARVTWSLDTQNGTWHEMAYWNGSATFEHHLANCYAYCQGWHIVGDRQSGKIYRMSRSYYDDNGQPIRRVRTTPYIHTDNKQLTVSQVELICETGKGNTTGLGSDPQIMLRYSNDGGYTWSSEVPRSMGPLGQYGKRVTWNRLGMARSWMFEFIIHDPVKFGLIDLTATIESSNGD